MSNRKWATVGFVIAVLVGAFFVLVSFWPKERSGQELSDEMLTKVSEYYKENGTILSLVSAEKSLTILSEKDAIEDFTNRGFYQYTPSADYSIEGKPLDETAIDTNGSDEHPTYNVYYSAPNDDLWLINSINGQVTAYPISYNLQSNRDVEVLIAEAREIYSYDSKNNFFILSVPHEDALVVKVVDEINARVIDTMTIEVIDEL